MILLRPPRVLLDFARYPSLGTGNGNNAPIAARLRRIRNVDADTARQHFSEHRIR